MNRRRRIAWCVVTGAVAVALAILCCPKPDLYGDTGFSLAVEDREHRLLRLALARDEHYRLRVSLDDVAAPAIDATLLYEDRRFRLHPGFNPASLLRAAWSTYVGGDRAVGGSTITMQLARIRFGLDTRSIAGKLVQIARAVQLERHYSKDEILEAYLNLAPYGGNVVGIGTASLVYFDKPASRLALPEALALAVIPQNPTGRNPASPAGYDAMLDARSRLFEAWARRYGADARLVDRVSMPLAVRSPADLPFRAPHFATGILSSADPGQGAIATTLDMSLQARLERHVANHIERHGDVGIENASVMLVDHRSLEVLAAVGSADFGNDRIAGQVDGTRAKRSPGSTLKPFVYGLAIDRGLIHPMTLMNDAPRRFAAFTPENFDRGYMGPVFAQDALVYSRNVPAIELLNRVGLREFHDFLTNGGLADLEDAEHYGLALVLGGLETTMEELVELYAALENGGEWHPLKRRPNEDAGNEGKRLLSPEASFLVLDMLSRNPRPDALALGTKRHARVAAWKTGTSYAFRDAWTVGSFGPWVLAVWVGNFDGSSNPAFVGRQAAAPLFFAIADDLSGDIDSAGLARVPPPGLNVRKVDVCASTGDLPGKHCPATAKSWFVPGVSPIRVSDIHRAVRIDDETGLRACRFDPATTHEEVFEFWPSDIARLFRSAGIAIRKPPPWSPDCALGRLAASGAPPRISSISAHVAYQLRSASLADERIPLGAVTDADASWIYWFVDDRFVGKAASDDLLLWRPVAGTHDVLAVDDLGRSDSLRLTVAMAR